MKTWLKNNFKRNLTILSGLVFTISIVFILSALAQGRYTIAFFYADWNLSCREAKPIIESVSRTYNNVSLQEINIDQPNAPAQARSLGLTLPRSIPHIYVLDSSGRVALDITYSGESQQQLKSRLDSVILR